MVMTLVQQETFDGYGDLNSGTPGNLGGSVSGNFSKRPGGPRASGMSGSLGWSALTVNAAISAGAGHRITLPAGQQPIGAFSAWYRVSSAATDGTNDSRLMQLTADVGGGLNVMSQIVNTTQSTLTGYSTLEPDQQYQVQSTSVNLMPITIDHNQWFQLTVAWENGGTNNFAVHWWLYVPGDETYNTPTLILSRLHNSFNNDADSVLGGMLNTGGSQSNNFCRMRYGLPTLWEIDALSDVNDANYDRSDETPNHGRIDYKLRPGDGTATDAGDGIAQPWATWDRLMEALSRGELMGTPEQYWDSGVGAEYAMPTATPPTTARMIEFAKFVKQGRVGCKPTDGSRVMLDSDLEMIEVTTDSYPAATYSLRGILFTSTLNLASQLGLTRATAFAPSWTSEGGYTNVYSAPIGSSPSSLMMWQFDDGELTAATGISIQSVQATALAEIEANPGRYWFSGSTVYVSTSDGAGGFGGAPDVTGRTWLMSTAASDNDNVMEFGLATDICFDGVVGRYAGGMQITGSCVGGYLFRLTGNGYCKDFIAERGCKHQIGTVDSSFNNATTAWVDGNYRGGPANHGFGAHSPAVVFRSGSKTGGGAVFINARCTAGEEIEGESGFSDTVTNANAFYGHNAGTGNLDLIALIDCGNIPGKYSVANGLPAVLTLWQETTANTVGTRLNFEEYKPFSTNAVRRAIAGQPQTMTKELIANG